MYNFNLCVLKCFFFVILFICVMPVFLRFMAIDPFYSILVIKSEQCGYFNFARSKYLTMSKSEIFILLDLKYLVWEKLKFPFCSIIVIQSEQNGNFYFAQTKYFMINMKTYLIIFNLNAYFKLILHNFSEFKLDFYVLCLIFLTFDLNL